MKIESSIYLDKLKNAANDIKLETPKSKPKQYLAAFAALLLVTLALFPTLRWTLVFSIYMPLMSELHFAIPEIFDRAFKTYISLEADMALPLQAQYTESPVILAKDFTWEKFLEVSHDMSHPVVIKGLFSDSVAAKTFFSDEWINSHSDFSLETLAKKKSAVEDGKKYAPELVTEDFMSYVRDIQSGTYRYSYGLDELFTRYPELVEDLELKRFGARGGNPNFCQAISAIISSEGPGLKWHNADHSTFQMQIQGGKTFEYIDPKYSLFTGPAVIAVKNMKSDPFGIGFSCRSPLSVIDRIPKFRSNISAGDVTFTPAWWWHNVQTYADPKTKFSVLATCRFVDTLRAMRHSSVMELYRHWGFANWVDSTLPIAVRWIPFFRVVQDGFRQIFDKSPAWDSDQCYSAKRKACEKYFDKLEISY